MQNSTGAPKNFITMGMDAVKAEGIASLWKGNYVNCLRVVPQYALKVHQFQAQYVP